MAVRWDVITIGNLSRNRYWGEGDDAARRGVLCTTTLVRCDDFKLVVDPSVSDPKAMATELDRRTGIAPAAIDAVFITHEHGDHHAGLVAFESARWLAAPAVAEAINHSRRYEKAVEAVTAIGTDGVEMVRTPGHTAGHHSLLLVDSDGMTVVIAGDAVVTRDFWADKRGFFNSTEPELASETMRRLATMADIIVPGHDNYFLTQSRGQEHG
jgi:glyoxylase-like metal-dependent hydrolase (beta-lactamase superfamily II)